MPLLTNPAYADYMNEYGRVGLAGMERKAVKFLARLNWYTIEFGLIRKPEGVRIYGAGIVSSYGEAKYVAGDVSAHEIAFDLERGSLLRVRLFTSGPTDHVLLVTLHHIAMDFWSFVVLMDDLAAFYGAEIGGTPPALAPPVSAVAPSPPCLRGTGR